MASIREYIESVLTFLAQVAPSEPVSDYQRGVLEGMQLLLNEQRTTWQTNELWNREVFCTDFLAHLQRTQALIEQRLGLVAAGTQTMAAGSTETAANVHEGSP